MSGGSGGGACTGAGVAATLAYDTGHPPVYQHELDATGEVM